MNTDSNFKDAVDTYLGNADYLTDSDLPLIVALKKTAEELDANGVSAALVNVFGVTMRALQKRAGATDGKTDPHEDFLDNL